jgi:hypothetical protein
MFVSIALKWLMCAYISSANALDYSNTMMPLEVSEEAAPFALSKSWQVLGPFQIGTRGMLHRL